MPIIASAKKQMRQNLKARIRNVKTRSLYRNAMKKLFVLVKEGKKDEAAQMLSYVFKTIDTAAKKRVIAKNKADRHKSQCSKALA